MCNVAMDRNNKIAQSGECKFHTGCRNSADYVVIAFLDHRLRLLNNEGLRVAQALSASPPT